jgi:hypothetical protein
MAVSKFRTALACALTIGTTGCTQYWAKPGGTQLEFEATKSACQTQAFAQFPAMPQQVMLTTGYITPVQTSCAGSGYAVNCFSTGGQYVPPAYVTVDQNQGARNSAVRSCLFEAGWRPVKDREEAIAVTESASAPAVSSDAAYEAGLYCDRYFKTEKNAAMMAVFNNDYNTCYFKRARELQGAH